MDQENGSDSPTEPKTLTNGDDGDETESDDSGQENKKKNGNKKGSNGQRNVSKAHNPYKKPKSNGPSVSVANKSNKKGEESITPSTAEAPTSLPCHSSRPQVQAVCL